MSDSERHLISILISRQLASGLSDSKWALDLGTTQAHWWRLKRGKRGIGKRMAQRILARYSDLWREVQDALLPTSVTDAA